MQTTTCIIALRHEGALYIAGDSAGSAGWTLRTIESEKVFRRGGFLFGFTSSWRMGQLLRYTVSLPKHKEGQSTIEYLCTDFVAAVRQCFKDHGFAKVEHSQEQGGCFLVGYRDAFFLVEDNFQVLQVGYPYCAVGCGEEVAMGSLHSTEGQDPVVRLRKALSASEEFSAGVRRPFRYVSTEFEGIDFLEPVEQTT